MQAGVDLEAWGACSGVSTQHRRYADIKHSKLQLPIDRFCVMVISGGLRSTLRRSILQHFSGEKEACPLTPLECCATNTANCMLYARINLHSVPPPPPSHLLRSIPANYPFCERYLTLIGGYILSPGGLGMVGKVVNIQAWKKESAVSGWMSSV